MYPRYTLEQALNRIFRRVQMRRGRGSYVLPDLLRRVREGEAQIDDTTQKQLAEVLASLEYAIDDLKAEANRNMHVTAQAISRAIRRGG